MTEISRKIGNKLVGLVTRDENPRQDFKEILKILRKKWYKK